MPNLREQQIHLGLEVHPTGSEVVLCAEGEMTLIQESDARSNEMP